MQGLSRISARRKVPMKSKSSRNVIPTEDDERLRETMRVNQIVNPSALLKDNIQYLNAEQRSCDEVDRPISRRVKDGSIAHGHKMNRDISHLNIRLADTDSDVGAEKGQQTSFSKSFCAYATAERSRQRTPDGTGNEQPRSNIRRHEINIIQLVFKTDEQEASPGRQTESHMHEHEADNKLANRLGSYRQSHQSTE